MRGQLAASREFGLNIHESAMAKPLAALPSQGAPDMLVLPRTISRLAPALSTLSSFRAGHIPLRFYGCTQAEANLRAAVCR